MEIQLKQPYSFCQLGKRTNQEDARFPNKDIPQGCKAAFVVCDGVGGQDCGEIASRIVADTIGQRMQEYDLSKAFNIADFESVLDEAFHALDNASKRYGTNMATTMTFVCLHADGAFVAHIGDSRIYHIRPGVGIMYQSEDHSLVTALVHSGNITPEEAINHPQSNIITRCMRPLAGEEAFAATTFQIKDIEAGDYFFMCTDGVLHNVDDVKLQEIISSTNDDLSKINQLATLSENSSDNNTAYLIGIADVIYDISEDSSAADNECLATSDTIPLKTLNKEVAETKKIKRKTLSTQISDFFDKLF